MRVYSSRIIFMLVLWAHTVVGQPGPAPDAEILCSGPPGVPSTITPTTVDAKSAEICWSPPQVGEECVTGYQVQLGTDPARAETGPCATFTGLDAGSDYVILVRSVGQDGTESDPVEATFTTTPSALPSPEPDAATPPPVVDDVVPSPEPDAVVPSPEPDAVMRNS